MKKFILLFLLFVSPSFASADVLGGVGGGAVGVALGSLVGGGQGKLAAQVILGIAGANVGSRLEDGTYGRNSPVANVTEEVVYVGRLSNPGFVCQGNPNYGMDQYPPGYCHDSDSGGYASYDNLRERYYRKLNERERQNQYRQVGYQYDQPSVFTTNAVLVKRTTVTKPAIDGPTINDYMEPRKVHSSCQSGNHGADGRCLLRFVDQLLHMQAACEKSTTAPSCTKNPGKIAGDWNRLGKELIELQIKEQGGLSSLQ